MGWSFAEGAVGSRVVTVSIIIGRRQSTATGIIQRKIAKRISLSFYECMAL